MHIKAKKKKKNLQQNKNVFKFWIRFTYRSLVGTDLRGYLGFRGKDNVFGRRNVTLVRILRVRVPNGPLTTFFCTFLARTTAAATFLFLADVAALADGFFNVFTLAANFVPALVVAFLAIGFLTETLAFGLAAAAAGFLVAGFLAATFLAVGLAVAGFFDAGALASPAGRLVAGFLSAALAGTFVGAGLAAAGLAAAGLAAAGLAAAGFFSVAGFLAAGAAFLVSFEVEAAGAAFFSPIQI